MIDNKVFDSDKYENTSACIVITIMTDLGWYRDRYSKFVLPETTVCQEAIDLIEQYLNYYNAVYDVDLESDSITAESPTINRLQKSIDELKGLV